MEHKEYKIGIDDAGKTLEISDEKNKGVDIIIPERNFTIGGEVKVFKSNESVVRIKPEYKDIEIVSSQMGFDFFAPTFFIRKYNEIQIKKRALNKWVIKGNVVLGECLEGGDEVYEKEENGILYRFHMFASVGENELKVVAGNGKVEYLLVGGGGGGGAWWGAGGGGGGGVICREHYVEEGEVIHLGVGDGGAGGDPVTDIVAEPGEESFIKFKLSSTIIAPGGGRAGQGGNDSSHQAGGNGGSGGGAGRDGNIGMKTDGIHLGSNGGSGESGGGHTGGGGGGAGGDDGKWGVSNIGGDGGNGAFFWGYYWGGGGGGGAHGDDLVAEGWVKGGDGGLGGGGGGAAGYLGSLWHRGLGGTGGLNPGGDGGTRSDSAIGGDGGANTGGGGGGGDYSYNPNLYNPGGKGGSGIVIVRYPIGQAED